MADALHRTGARGGGITVIGQAARMLLQFASVVVLSRLLAPEDFGLVAMVAVFMMLADLIRDFGLSGAALQAEDLNHQQASNLFWASTSLGLLCAGALAASTPLLVALYDEPRLGAIVPAMSITLVLGGAQAQIQVQLARGFRFTALAVTSVLAPAVGLALAIWAAVSGWQYWSLVLLPIATAATLLLTQLIAARWIPGLPRRSPGSRQLFQSGAQLGAAYLLTWAASNVDSLLAGARWGAIDLGYYNRAYQLTATTVGGFLAPLTQVALPLLNAAAREGRKARDLLLRLQFLVAAPVTLMMVAFALTAPSLIPLVLGPGWEPAIPVVQILAVGECIHALSFISYWGFLAHRLSKQLLYYNMVTKPIAVALVVVASNWGIEAIAWAYVAGLAIAWPINLLWLAKTAGLDAARFLGSGLRILVAGAVTYAGIALLLSDLLSSETWRGVFVGAGCAIVLNLGIIAVLPGGRAELLRAIRMVCSLR